MPVLSSPPLLFACTQCSGVLSVRSHTYMFTRVSTRTRSAKALSCPKPHQLTSSYSNKKLECSLQHYTLCSPPRPSAAPVRTPPEPAKSKTHRARQEGATTAPKLPPLRYRELYIPIVKRYATISLAYKQHVWWETNVNLSTCPNRDYDHARTPGLLRIFLRNFTCTWDRSLAFVDAFRLFCSHTGRSSVYFLLPLLFSRVMISCL